MSKTSRFKNLPTGKKVGIIGVLGVITGTVICIAIFLPLGAFSLSSNAGSPDADGTFTLTWTPSSGASSYSVYEYNSFITDINGSVTALGTTSSQSKVITGRTAGIYYFLVQATGISGTTRSNCLCVSIGWQAWNWATGSSTRNQTGSYGVQRTEDPTNNPGARRDGASWVDANGNLWLFGGEGYNDTSEDKGQLNDLWRFNIASGVWTWMHGSASLNRFGTYGTKGAEGPANTPGGRYGSVAWTSADGNLWLLGGYGFGESGGTILRNDLWRFNVTSLQWAWMDGDKEGDTYGIYGEMSVEAASNYPGIRYGSIVWTRGNNEMWMFGGYGFGETTGNQRLNDLWRLNMSSLQWTWMNGSKEVSALGTYGEKGIEAPVNTPGGRYAANSWIDAQGDLWLFGGYGFNATAIGALNDLWRFNTTSCLWAWENGSCWGDQEGTFGMKGTPSPDNTPGGRENGVSWTDASGNLWLFGGYGNGSSGYQGYLNDLWRFDTTSSQWTWVNGSSVVDQNGNLGSKGVPSLDNIPSARCASTPWTGKDGCLWLLGGYGRDAIGEIGCLNDLWQYFP